MVVATALMFQILESDAGFSNVVETKEGGLAAVHTSGLRDAEFASTTGLGIERPIQEPPC